MNYQFAEINGTQIHYDVQGEGTAVVFIHAGIANLGMWDEQMADFTARHRVVRYDLRGWGQTTNPPGSFSDHDDLRQLLDLLGIEQAAVVGCSIGGETAVEFAVTYPERVSKLVLVCSGLGGYQYPDLPDDDPIIKLMTAAGEATERGDLDTAAEMETHLWFDGLNRQPQQVDPDKRARAYGLVRAALDVAKGEGKRLPVEPPPIAQLGNITAPTLIIVGAEDLPDVADVAGALEAGIANTRRVTLADTAHLPNVEKPADFNQIVLDFLQQRAWRSTLYAIVLDGAKVWLTEAGALPQVKVNGDMWDTEAGQAKRPFQPLLGSAVHPLYRAHFRENEATQTAESVYVMEGAEVAGLNGRWVGADELAAMGNPDHRALVAACLQERLTGQVPSQRTPWGRPGWLAEVTAWIETALAARNETVVPPVEVARSWGLSCVLKAQTANLTAYCKTVADLPLFVNEAAVVAVLSRLFPGSVPQPLAVHADRSWLLLPELKEMVGWHAPLAQRQAMLADFAQLQQTAVSHVPTLLAAGCLDRRLAQLPAQIEAFLTADMVLAAVSVEEQSQLRALIPQLQAACARLSTFGLPETLVHGDLHGGNVAVENGRFVYFDWTDACISHPFFDMVDIFFEKETAVQTQLRDAYLAQWADYGPPEQLLAAWSLANVLASVHHGVSYWQILANIEPQERHQLTWSLPFWLQRLRQTWSDYGGQDENV